MIFEVIGTATTYSLYKYFTSDKYKIKKTILDVADMNNLDIKIIEIHDNDYTFDVIVRLYVTPFHKLKGIKNHLQNALGRITTIEENEDLKTATICIVKERLTDNTRFKAIKLNDPLNLYFGLGHSKEQLLVNMFSFPHVLVSGQTGSGKTEIIRLALANSIYNFSSKELEIYFSDLSNMNDYDIFQKCSNTRGYARNINECIKLFNYLEHIYNKRLSIFKSRKVKNFKEYNQKYTNKKMSVIYLVLDEFADFFPSNRIDSNYKKKVKCYNMLEEFVRKFRKTGMFLIVGIQRPDTSVLDPSLRSNLCTKIGFSQNNNASSLVVSDTEELANIANREGLFMYGNKRIQFHSLYLNDKIIYKLIKDKYVYGTRNNYNKFLREEKKSKSVIPLKQTNKSSKAKIEKNKHKCKGIIKL